LTGSHAQQCHVQNDITIFRNAASLFAACLLGSFHAAGPIRTEAFLSLIAVEGDSLLISFLMTISKPRGRF
jgi:hypothetical protein